ncbi:hypothetical protein [Bdellovibrio sp. NC01]|uniref:hypothetical protein n=1 Tax=Bdellovibrio sp. NC01 TaxID=2220073 RepID=UPI0011591D7E|nr:hypothetical protein [Bdellovibrio sp. NC01]QDK36831.1 hypothetical protein DOE51_04085 [Bdellovibrio sp. NC01]
MEKIIAFISILFVAVTASAEEPSVLVCQRPIVQQAIALAQKTVQSTPYKIKSRAKQETSDLRIDLAAIKLLEKTVFKKQMFDLGYDFVVGASISFEKGYTPLIRIYPDTIAELNKLDNAEYAHLFTMAHEMGHMVQGIWQAQDPNKLTPHKMVSLDGNVDNYNRWHSETDCFGVELMYQAGVRDFSAVIPALDSIRKDCYSLREKEFCDSAFAMRAHAVQLYLQNNPELTKR